MNDFKLKEADGREGTRDPLTSLFPCRRFARREDQDDDDGGDGRETETRIQKERQDMKNGFSLFFAVLVVATGARDAGYLSVHTRS